MPDMTTTPIVVGVDFSPESDRAVAHAMDVARRTGSPLTLVHVGLVPDEPVGLSPSMAETAETMRTVLLERLAQDRAQLADLRERLSGQGVEVSHVVVDGFADTAVAKAARELDARMVVVGTHGRTGFRRLVLGSVAEKTIRTAEMSVLVPRGDAPSGGYQRVVVGTDFSDGARHALVQALEVAAPEAKVRVVHAWALPYGLVDLDGRVVSRLYQDAEAAAAALRDDPLLRARPNTTVEVGDGSPAMLLDSLSDEADLIVVGSHGRRGFRRFLLGSVAEATVRHARCSVLVAR